MKVFNVQPFLDAANILVTADEIELALQVLNLLPAYYRDNQPPEVIALRNEIMARIATPVSYVTIESSYGPDTDDRYNMADNSLRGKMLTHDVRVMNDNGMIPHIVDFAPGEFWAPAMLVKKGLSFTYWPVLLNKGSLPKLKEHYGTRIKETPGDDRPYIFAAFEIIEHLYNPNDIKSESLRWWPRLPDVIHVSTPLYSFDTECMNWRTRDLLGHLRAYSPNELHTILARLFPEYDQELQISQIMHSRMILKDTKFEIEKKSSALV